MVESQAKACCSCFMTDGFPGVGLGSDGRCNFCASGEFIKHKTSETNSTMEELRKIADGLRATRAGKYDCIIGASGGLDSSYVLYIAKMKLGLNPLVVTYDHGFNYPLGARNLSAMCSKLGVDMLRLQSKKGHDRRYVKFMARALRAVDLYWGVCQACHFVLPAAVYKTALREKIAAVLVSLNSYEWPLPVTGKYKLRFLLRTLMRTSPAGLLQLAFYAPVAQYHLLRLKLEYYFPPLGNLVRTEPRAPGLRFINVTKYVPWNLDEMVATLERETGWRAPDPPHIPMRFDCRIEDSLMDYTFKKATGLSVHGIICSRLAHEGIRTKQDLLPSYEYHENGLAGRVQEVLRQAESQ